MFRTNLEYVDEIAVIDQKKPLNVYLAIARVDVINSFRKVLRYFFLIQRVLAHVYHANCIGFLGTAKE